MKEELTSKEMEVLSNLIKIDNMIMKTDITVDDVLSSVEFNDITLNNALIIYNGDINVTKKIVNSNITNSLLVPNRCYLAINKFLISGREDLDLYVLPSEAELISNQDQFDSIVVIDDIILYDSVKDDYKNAKFIELK